MIAATVGAAITAKITRRLLSKSRARRSQQQKRHQDTDDGLKYRHMTSPGQARRPVRTIPQLCMLATHTLGLSAMPKSNARNNACRLQLKELARPVRLNVGSSPARKGTDRKSTRLNS